VVRGGEEVIDLEEVGSVAVQSWEAKAGWRGKSRRFLEARAAAHLIIFACFV
jgi:hypothetical protein